MEDNLKRPAYPISEKDFMRFNKELPPWAGFTKLEKAALMIAQGWLAGTAKEDIIRKDLAEAAVAVAKAVLEEANK